MTYSQNEEEGIINNLFGDRGRFLDVGAYEGKTFSNTLRLFERGWQGVLLEPSPKAFAGLKKNYEGKEGVVLIQAAIADKSGQVVFYDSGGDAISSTELTHAKKWEAGYKCKFDKIIVSSITWDEIFDTYGVNFDFVNIDTEGTNLDLLLKFPFSRLVPRCLCVEFDGHAKEMQKHLNAFGYRNVYQSGENVVWWRDK